MTGEDRTTPRPDHWDWDTSTDEDWQSEWFGSDMREAVAEIARLRAIEEAARGPVSDAFAMLDALREVARQAGDFHLLSALEPARHAASRLRAALEGAPHE